MKPAYFYDNFVFDQGFCSTVDQVPTSIDLSLSAHRSFLGRYKITVSEHMVLPIKDIKETVFYAKNFKDAALTLLQRAQNAKAKGFMRPDDDGRNNLQAVARRYNLAPVQ